MCVSNTLKVSCKFSAATLQTTRNIASQPLNKANWGGGW